MDALFPPLPDGEPFDAATAAVMLAMSGMDESESDEDAISETRAGV
jgi:hypothetical protein